VVVPATVNRPARRPWNSAAVCLISSSRANTVRALATIASPAEVGRAPPGSRSTSCTPNELSNARIWLETAGWLR